MAAAHATRPMQSSPDALTDCLRHALADAGLSTQAGAPLERLPGKGLAHDHVRLAGTGWLARIPKQSQLGLPAGEALAYEAACFTQAAASGHTPLLHGVLPPSRGLPRGALLVQEIAGRPARLPHDLPALAQALAALHRLPLPAPGRRAPLLQPPDALAALLRELQAQAAHADAALLPPAAARAIDDGLEQLRGWLRAPLRPAVRLVAFDAHPGNFVVDATGRAWLVDLEKCRWSHPGLDLAHATLYTSTTWDVESRAALAPAQVLDFYSHWAAAVDPALAADARPWHAPLRRAMWLWSLTWCAKWQALSPRPAHAQPPGEDWSAAASDPSLVAHVDERVRHYLGAEAVGRVLHELDLLERAWST